MWCITIVDFQSQSQSLPSPSPLVTYLLSRETPIWHAYPAIVCPTKCFFLLSLNLDRDLECRV